MQRTFQNWESISRLQELDHIKMQIKHSQKSAAALKTLKYTFLIFYVWFVL